MRRSTWLAMLLPLMSGCSFGALALEGSHGRYQESVKRVQDEEFLRNIVHLRYNDSMNNLDVSSIATQYELGATAEARPFFLAPNPDARGIFRTFDKVLPDAQLNGANRPTITMVPADDSETIRRLLTPAVAESIIFFMESGWPVSTICRLWLDGINQIPNAPASRGAGPNRSEVPDFQRFQTVVDLLDRMQNRDVAKVLARNDLEDVGRAIPAGLITAEAQVEAAKNNLEFIDGPGPDSMVLARPKRSLVLQMSPSAANDPETRELFELMGVRPGSSEYRLTTKETVHNGPSLPPALDEVIQLKTRSVIQVLFYMSHGVVVPPAHFEQGLIHPTLGPDGRPFDWTQVTRGLFSVCHARHRPQGAYVAVKYRDYWFYIDDQDTRSKISFNLMRQLSKLELGTTQPRNRQSGPILTLPVGR